MPSATSNYRQKKEHANLRPTEAKFANTTPFDKPLFQFYDSVADEDDDTL